MRQYVIVYGPPEQLVVYATASPDVDLARAQRWECEQRHPGRNARVMSADVVPVPAEG